MKLSKAALFGGALMSAGIAKAGVFEFTTGLLGESAYSISSAYSEPDLDTQSAAAYDNNPAILTFAAEGTVSTGGIVNDTIISANAFTASPTTDTAYTDLFAYVSFASTTEILVNWDYTNGSGLTRVTDTTPGRDTEVFFTDFGVGFQGITLTAGRTYLIEISAEIDDILETSAGASYSVIPAPGAATLAGFAGLAALRRRR